MVVSDVLQGCSSKTDTVAIYCNNIVTDLCCLLCEHVVTTGLCMSNKLSASLCNLLEALGKTFIAIFFPYGIFLRR